jgi:hypothetical protein
MTFDEILEQVNIKATGRTRWEGQEPFWDEQLVKEIERLREIILQIRNARSYGAVEVPIRVLERIDRVLEQA